MNSKSFLIAVAAFAVTASGAYAFNDTVLKRAGLSEEQIAAFEIAHELKREGDPHAARDILLEAGIDDAVLEQIRAARFAEREQGSRHHSHHRPQWQDLSAAEYEAYQVARRANDHETAHAILVEAGIQVPHESTMKRHQFQFSSAGQE